ncbi:MAG TPA: hypothetical protein ENK84_06045 [Desulfobulbus sp.]|nr:hypothetical protein [Desulfobulbus sp.]
MNSTNEIPVQSNIGVVYSRHSSEYLFKQIVSERKKYDFLIPAYITVVCAGIEGKINTAFIDCLHKRLGKEYKTFVRPYLFMRIRDRFEQMPIIVSNFKYRLNTKNEKIKEIFKIFEFRNQLVHVKQHWHYADPIHDENGELISLKYKENNTNDPYRTGFVIEKLSEEELAKIFNVYKSFISKFSNIANNINRKNFNPENWFVKI